MKQIKLTFGTGYFKLNNTKYPKGNFIIDPQGNKINIINIFTDKSFSIDLEQFVDSEDNPFDSMDSLINAFDFSFSNGGSDGIGVTRDSNTVLFDKDYVIGELGARTGDIIVDVTGGKPMSTTMMLHNDASPFTFFESDGVTPFVFWQEIGFYETGVDNILDFQFLWTGAVRLTISQR